MKKYMLFVINKIKKLSKRKNRISHKNKKKRNDEKIQIGFRVSGQKAGGFLCSGSGQNPRKSFYRV